MGFHQRKACFIGIIVAVAVAVAVVLGVTLSKNNVSNNAPDSTKDSINQDNSSSSIVKDSDLLSNVSTMPVYPTSNPETSPAAFTFLAIGDWGSTTGKAAGIPGSCCKLYKATGQIDTSKPRYMVDYYSQQYVAELLAKSAAELKPTRILGHGDNIYWNGVGSKDVGYRMEETFEKMYSQKSLKGIKWVNVAGNHDIGGSAFICGDQDSSFRECGSTDELLKFLDMKFTLQAQYKSPNGDRYVIVAVIPPIRKT